MLDLHIEYKPIKNALTLARLCSEAYEKTICAPNSYVTVDELQSFDKGVNGFVCREGINCVLVFRGTDLVPIGRDIITDAKLAMTYLTFGTNTKYGMVHKGFYEAWMKVEPIVTTLMEKYRKYCQRFWIAGHSMGGAVATLASMYYNSKNLFNGLDGKKPPAYTFGSPKLFDEQAMEAYDHKQYRYVHTRDPVPLFPISWAHRKYTHVKEHVTLPAKWRPFIAEQFKKIPRWLTRLEKSYEESCLVDIRQHHIVSYIESLQDSQP